MAGQVVYIVCAEGEEDRAELLAQPLRAAGYEVTHDGTLTVGESTVGTAVGLLESGAPIVLCATTQAVGSAWSHQIVNAGHAGGHNRVFVVQMERQAYVDQLAMRTRVARYCDDPKLGLRMLLEALSKHYPPFPAPPPDEPPAPPRGELHYLDEPTAASTFDLDALQRFRDDLRDDIAEGTRDLTHWEFLEKAGVWSGGHLTRTGVLLFGKSPTSACITAQVRCVRYYGSDPADAKDMPVTFDGTLTSQIIAAREFIADLVRRGERPSSERAQPVAVYRYPMLAVREIIANALVHRDYSYSHDCVHVRLYDDRLEVTSPGIWLGHAIPSDARRYLAELKGHSVKRNFRLAHLVSWVKLVEGEGSGIPTALRDCREVDAPVPVVSQQHDVITVTLLPRQPDPAPAADDAARPRPESPRRPVVSVWGGVPPRDSNFTGRDDVLGHMRASLAGDRASATLIQPLIGLGGVGKTQLAAEFAYRFQLDYDLVWWVPAEDDRSIRRSLVSLARRVGLPVNEDVQDTIDTVLDALRRGEPHRRWLIIYDNAPEPGLVTPYLPSGRGHVLVTARSRSWAGEPGAIEIDVFTPHESVGLLRHGWPGLSEEMALELAGRLGHLPLALEQAVSVHQQTGMPLPHYLAALDESPATLLDEGAPGTSVARTLSLSFDALRSHSPAAASLLEVCAFLSSNHIAVPLLSAGRGAELPADLKAALQSDIALRRAIRDLGRFALAQIDPGRDLIRIHSLVRAILRDAVGPERRVEIERSAHALLATANPGDPDSPSSWFQLAQIAPHVVPSGLVHSAAPASRRAVLDQVRYAYAIGDFVASRRLAEGTLEAWRAAFGPDDESTLVVSRHLANALRAEGDYGGARELNRRTLDRMTATLGAEHEHSLATANSVAADLRFAGRFREALELDELNLRLHEHVLGPHNPSTIRVMTNLAVDHRLLGDFARARTLDEDNLARKIQIYGEDHPRTLFSYTCLIRDLYGLGRYQEGLALAQEKIARYEGRLPATHADVLIARRHLAMLLRRTGHVDDALEVAEQTYDAHVRTFGPAHEHSLSALVTLMNCRRSTNDLDGAVESGRRALLGYTELLSGEHPFTYACMVDLSIALRLVGDLDEAEQVNDVALAGLSMTLGDDHPYTLCGLHTQANVLAARHRTEEARAVSERALELSRRVLGANHPYTLACAVNLALDLDAAGEAGASTALRRSTFAQIKRVLGADHPAADGGPVRTESEIEVPAT